MKDEALKRLLPGADPRLVVQSLVQGLRVLQVVGQAGRALSLSEIAGATGIDRSAAQRFAYTLESIGYLERGAGGKGYGPGRQVLDRSFEYLRSNPLVERATPVLTELRKSTRERVDLSLFDGLTSIYAIRLQSKRETFNATLVGRRLPTFCTSGGRAMLSLLPDEELSDVLGRSDLVPFTPRTMIDPVGIMACIARARQDGYALVMEEMLMGEIAIGAAVSNAEGRPVAAVHVAGSLSEWQEHEFRARFAPLAMEAAAALRG